MQCLVTGATGYLGRALTPALQAAGHTVIGQCARSADPADPGEKNLLIRRDFRDGVAGIVPANTDCVLHLAGIAHQSADAADYYQINVAATLDLARDASARGVRRFIYVSSVKAALAQADDGSVRGNAARVAESVHDYTSSKAVAEAGLRELCDSADMALIIVRPALVYSVDAPGHLQLLRRWVERRLPRPPAGGERSMIARADLVRLLALLTDGALPQPEPLIATDGEAYSTRRIHAALCRALQRSPLLPSPPPALWQLAANTRDRWQGLPVGSTWQRLVGQECYQPQGLAALGFSPQLTLEHSLEPRA